MDEAEFHKRQTKYLSPPKDDDELAKKFDENVERFKKISSYVAGPYDEDSGFQNLLKHVEELEKGREGTQANRVFYMALPPSVFTVVAKGLKKNVYSKEGSNRIIIEKPFGKDLESCREMMTALGAEWAENETYRIDHYLGKEMIKNMLVLRFGNVFLDAALNRNFVSNVQITFKEPFGTEGRGGYFDEFGIIRDVCQNRESLQGGDTIGDTTSRTGANGRPASDPFSPRHGAACVVLGRRRARREGACMSVFSEAALTPRSRCCDVSRRSRRRTSCSASTPPTATSRVTTTTTLCRRTLSAPPTLP